LRPSGGRPTKLQSAELEERLRNAAVDVFLDNGYEAATMEAIAQAAQITKRTLYAKYVDKKTLFADAVTWALGRYHSPALPADLENWDIGAALTEIARSTLARSRDPDVARLNRMAVTESHRIPDLSSRAYLTTWSPRVGAVIELLTFHKKAGTIVLKDVPMAAEHFIAMVRSCPGWISALGQSRPPAIEDRYMHYAVELFLLSIRSSEGKKAARSKTKR
jgi:AcrR family transcriptional regulator